VALKRGLKRSELIGEVRVVDDLARFFLALVCSNRDEMAVRVSQRYRVGLETPRRRQRLAKPR